MYLFRDNEKIEISIKCKACLKEFTYEITPEEYQSVEQFPIKEEYIHGDPLHKLTVFINKTLEIEDFEVEEIEEGESFSKQLTKQVLREIDLSDDEIELYFNTTGRDAVSIGELALLSSKSKEECEKIAQKFLEKGLFKKIVGATPHYRALPPYAALVDQLKKFHFFISDIKEKVPAQLNESFSKLETQAEGIKELKEYSNYMVDIKDNMLQKISSQKEEFEKTIAEIERIREITGDVRNLGEAAKNVMEEQVEGLSVKFKGINQQIHNGMNQQVEALNQRFEVIEEKLTRIIEEQIEDITANIKNIKDKISKNLEKLQLGVLQETVDLAIEKIFNIWLEKISDKLYSQLSEIKKITKDELIKTSIGLKRQSKLVEKTTEEGLEDISTEFNNLIETELKKSIDTTISNINELTTSTANSGDQVKRIFNEVSESFNEVIVDAENKITGISDEVIQSFQELKETFSSKVVDTLIEVLDKILNKLEISEETTKEFWEKAKKISLFTMKDIWFIRSEEAAKSNINEIASKAKARALIIAPKLEDIDIDAVKSCPRHVNVRISTFIDESLMKHQNIISELTTMQNVSLRHRDLKNLWAINKDYEEVVICVISQKEGDKNVKEIAGIGSIIQEHIKIFVPIIEDAWLNSYRI